MKILQIKTIQCLILKSLFESLKEIVFDVNIYFTNKSIKIMKMDHSRSMVLLLELYSSQFEMYKCGKIINNQFIDFTEDNPLIIGVNVLYLFRLLKNLTNDDILTLSIDDNNPGFLEIEIEKTAKNIISKYNLSLIELNEETLKPHELNYNNIIYGILYRYCRGGRHVLDHAEDLRSRHWSTTTAQRGRRASAARQPQHAR